ncbi:DUF814 domain-containing protein, partial [Candidatus Bathyarchaeota archaeon]|nr:fibronectin-binding domain-containing protein [Candidatus Bathyarchaeota archaeon]NIU81608.1 DUF814 domain-containing protein [Candidatus Bathyarchaeota archaeon]NIV68253.1 DUF814 domain-containing protein [Candidatus Bathyarchaeota archaeon]NIW16001.1 DUF814 domain-containing protein [Candidatus Bathyarchaeota archaeon]NIW34778.1 DUF814 domain-containing protein [Candidatus Bathyarchaeota archaeon]
DEGQWIDATPFQLTKYKSFRCETYNTLNQALDEYYTKRRSKERAAQLSKEVEQQIAKQKRVLERQQNALKGTKRDIRRNRKIGDIIYRNVNSLRFLLRRLLKEKREGRSWKQILSDIEQEKETGGIPASYLQSLQPEGLILNVEVEGRSFPLNLRHSIQENASHYYIKAKKAEKKLKGLKEAIQQSETKIEELTQQGIQEMRKEERPPPKRRKRAWYEKFRWFHSSDGLLVIGGRDTTTNEMIIKRHMEPHDIVFHADIRGAPFVLIKTQGEEPPERTMQEAAELAASYSKAWKEMLTSVNVYWISPEQVTKTPPPGQYLEKGAFVIRGSKNYLRNVPLQVAIGIKSEDGQPMVIGGPVEAITKEADTYVKLVPGTQKSSPLAKRIRKTLAKKGPEQWRRRILNTPLQRIQKFIPLGRGRIKPGS